YHGLHRMGAHTLVLRVLEHYGEVHAVARFAFFTLRVFVLGSMGHRCEVEAHHSIVEKEEESIRAELVSLGAIRSVVDALISIGVPEQLVQTGSRNVGLQILDRLAPQEAASPHLLSKRFAAYLGGVIDTCDTYTLNRALSLFKGITTYNPIAQVALKRVMLPHLMGSLQGQLGEGKQLADDDDHTNTVVANMDEVAKASQVNGPLAISLGVHTVALDCMATEGHPVRVYESCLNMIIGVAGEHESRPTLVALFKAGTIRAARAVMLAHPGQEEIAELTFKCVLCVGAGKVIGDTHKKDLIQLGVYRWAMAALSHYLRPESYFLAELCACTMLSCIPDEAVLKYLVQEDNVRTLLASLNMHRADERTTHFLCLLFQNIYALTEDVDTLLDQNVGDCVASAFIEHPKHDRIRQCYEFIRDMEESLSDRDYICRHCQVEHGKAACDALYKRPPPRDEVEEWERGTMYGDPQFAEDAPDHLLMNNETVEDMVRRQLGLRFGETLEGAYRHYGDLTLPPHSACVVYLPTMGQKRV
ncbi:hypothetical protein KIPB_009766, partial [Kipferlia bialata]